MFLSRARVNGLSFYYKQRQTVYDAYGNKCNCCGETNPLFLTIDHVNNDGFKDKTAKGNRRTGIWYVDKIIKANFPDSFQLLCYNCNYGKNRNKGICPHAV